jgi:hypothetical protein
MMEDDNILMDNPCEMMKSNESTPKKHCRSISDSKEFSDNFEKSFQQIICQGEKKLSSDDFMNFSTIPLVKYEFYLNKIKEIEEFFQNKSQNIQLQLIHEESQISTLMLKLTCFLCDINTISQITDFPPVEFKKALSLQTLVLAEMINLTTNKLVSG